MLLAPFACTAATTPVDLGTLGGSTSSGAAINVSDVTIVGAANLSGDANAHAFKQVYGGSLQDLGTLPLTNPPGNSSAAAASLANSVVGTSDIDITDPDSGDVNRYQHPFYYSGSTMQDVGTLGGSLAYANGIRILAVVGSSLISGDTATHAFIYRVNTSTMTDLGTLEGGLNSYALAINLTGVVAGASDSGDGTTHAVTWTGGTIRDLGNFNGGPFAQANAINDFGIPVGYGYLSDGMTAHAWVGNNMQDIGALPYGSYAQANAINDYGIVVGSSNVGTANNPDSDVHAFIYTTAHGMVDLNHYLPANSGWELQSANSIGLNGTVVGTGIYNGESHAFSWALTGHTED
jgi:probable HAF family extracellular repeat protein